MVLRLSLAAIAVVIAAWFAVSLRDARLEQSARETIGEQVRVVARDVRADHRRLAAADDQLRDAGLLNPDSSRNLERASAKFLAGREREAVAILERAVEREPENVQAWARLAIAARRTDPPVHASAVERLRELDPRGAGTAR